jgi:hypothetical protein
MKHDTCTKQSVAQIFDSLLAQIYHFRKQERQSHLLKNIFRVASNLPIDEVYQSFDHRNQIARVSDDFVVRFEQHQDKQLKNDHQAFQALSEMLHF